MVGIALNQLYSRIFCQATSSEECLLGVGNSEGKLIIYEISGLLQKNASGSKLHSPLHSIQAHNDSVYSMTSSGEHCITGATGTINGWKWKDLKKKISKPSFTISLECDQSNFGTPEVNSLTYDADRNLVYAACGDWKTRGYDLETGKETLSLEGHEDYVHDVVVSGNQVVSAGEDGQVLIWDPRVGREPKVKLQPHTYKEIQRPHIGKFISSVDIENDWLICGGGPQSAVFHLRSLAFTTALEPKEPAIYVTKFTRQAFDRGTIIVAGAAPIANICNISGEVTAEIRTSSSCIYSVNIMEKPYLTRILGFRGGQTQFGEFPWVATLLRQRTMGEHVIKLFLGGASLIHKRVVLTAAHKIVGLALNELQIRLGDWDVASEKEILPHQDVLVEEAIIHPGFLPGPVLHNVALLILKEDAKIDSHIVPICPAPDLSDIDATSCVINGWGLNEFTNGDYQKLMKSVTLPLVNKKRCQALLRKTRLGNYFKLHSSFICAGGEEGMDACTGDGGGPLACKSISDPSRYFQVGITAWGIGCGTKDVPGVYADVTAHYEWIVSEIKKRFPSIEFGGEITPRVD